MKRLHDYLKITNFTKSLSKNFEINKNPQFLLPMLDSLRKIILISEKMKKGDNEFVKKMEVEEI